MLRSFKLILSLLLISTLAKAQQITGKIIGAGTPLPGASLTIANSKLSVTADLSGNFTLYNTVIGKVTFKVSYIGYADKTIEIDAKPGLNDVATIDLLPDANALGEVIVKGASAASQAKAMTIKKTSLGIMEVLAADAIGKLPDRNAAEAIQRLQGVSIARDGGEGRYVTVRGVPTQWTAALLNGNHMPSASVDYADRRVQMDIFPSELIEYVQLSKAVTPDMEGDNIGGSINFITRAAPSKQVLNISAAGGYHTLVQNGSYNASVVYGNRILKNKLGFIFSGVVWDRTAETNRYNLDYNFSLPDAVQSFSLADLQLRDYNIHRSNIGLNGATEYVFNSKNKVFVKGIYNEYHDNQTVREEYFNFNAPSNITMQTRHTINKTKLSNIELGGVSTLAANIKLDWAASLDASSARSTNPSTGDVGYPIISFKQPVKYNNLSSDGKMYLKMDSPDGIGDVIDKVLPHNATPVNADSMLLNQVLVINVKNHERNTRLGANISYAVNPKLNLKFGGKFQHKYKSVDNNPLYVYIAGILGKAPALSSFNREPYPYNGGFLKPIGAPYNDVIINHISKDQIIDMVTPAFISQNKLYPAEMDSANNVAGAAKYYNGTEDVYAGYIMGDFKVSSKLSLIGGLRNEYNKGSYNSSIILTTTNAAGQKVSTISPIIQKNNYNALLPMLHAKYTPSDNDVIRLAYTRTFVRPDFGSFNPATIQNIISQTISQGNPDLKPTFSNNFDLMLEHYFGGVGVVNAGAFYKKLHDFIYSSGSSQNIDGINYRVSQAQNLHSAWLYGFEAGISKRFLKLPGFWKGFGIEANYTFINSQTKIPRLTSAAGAPDVYTYDVTTLPQQSKNIFNAVLLYEKDKFMARIAGNYKGQSVFTINSAAGPEHYVWTARNFTVDFSSSYAISKRIRVFVELNNITNAATRYYHGTYDRVYQAEWYGLRGQIGVNVKMF